MLALELMLLDGDMSCSCASTMLDRVDGLWDIIIARFSIQGFGPRALLYFFSINMSFFIN